MHETLHAEPVEEGTHLFGDLVHQLETGEQHECLAVGGFHEVLDPSNQSAGITGLARIRDFVDHKEFHLTLVIERRAHVKVGGPFRPNSNTAIVASP